MSIFKIAIKVETMNVQDKLFSVLDIHKDTLFPYCKLDIFLIPD